MNHNRFCANDNGTTAGPLARNQWLPPVPDSDPIRWASAATVGSSNTAWTGTSTLSSVFDRGDQRIADSESPPRSKNDSSTPTLLQPEDCA